ncbi:LPS export ABC transporter periplasmic protein LptC [Flavobacteriaceae bacterium]|nr:LPS export ABC transporter periplasmic protein LptC [Flavobacteriaceae bacterium]|tara:strand:- start:496 stop:1023 length:528 start_codon:yes stop_codon:yes gene_type:complete
MRVSYLLVFFFIVIFSCTTELAETTYSNKKIPVSIAKNFTMIYTDSMLTKSFVSGKIHYDFTNDLLNYSEFYEDVELVIYDENKTSTISSQYAIVYNSFRFMEFNNNVKITTSDGEVLTTDKLYYDTENEWLFTENNFEYIDKTNKIIANRLDSNRDFTDLVTGNLTGSINITEE